MGRCRDLKSGPLAAARVYVRRRRAVFPGAGYGRCWAPEPQGRTNGNYSLPNSNKKGAKAPLRSLRFAILVVCTWPKHNEGGNASQNHGHQDECDSGCHVH